MRATNGHGDGPRQRDQERLSSCAMQACRLHDGRAGCRMAAGVPRLEALRVLLPGGGLDQPDCALLDVLLARLRPRSARFERAERFGGSTPGNQLADLFFVLHKVAKAHAAGAVGVGYLLAAIATERVDEGRRREGRPRCGICCFYGQVSRRCLHREALHPGELEPQSEPSRLDPPCPSFRSLHSAAPEEPWPPASAQSPGEHVARALERLQGADREAWALIVEHHLEGRSLRELARRSGHDRRRIARELHRAEAELVAILDDLT